MRKLQVLQNKIMRVETGLDYTAPTQELINKTKQLSVHQHVAYHTLCQTHKILKSEEPKYHFDRISNSNDRSRTEGGIKRIDYDLSLARSSFFYQASRIWSLLPNNIKVLNKK